MLKFFLNRNNFDIKRAILDQLILIRVGGGDRIKDRQQETERHPHYLALLSSSNPHNIISYTKG